MATKNRKARRPKVAKSPPPHFAVGLPIKIREGARPAGWQVGEKFAGTHHWTRDDYTRTFVVQSVHDSGTERSTFEVAGWFWYPEDLEIPYR